MNGTVILDTNLLLLLIVGTASRSYIARHRRLRAYSEADFILLTQLLFDVDRVLLTPNTLTETSNLLGYIADPARTHIFRLFRELIDNGEERSIASRDAVQHPDFLRLGLTDSVLLSMGKAAGTLLTSDLDLYLAAMHRGVSAENFNHFRPM
ncbi:MAG: hypothetical protein JO267_15230 [Alphaproteobacteria bacterium]|nr:hypothetical protein [Alphaproteobacteria bacterium]